MERNTKWMRWINVFKFNNIFPIFVNILIFCIRNNELLIHFIGNKEIKSRDFLGFSWIHLQQCIIAKTIKFHWIISKVGERFLKYLGKFKHFIFSNDATRFTVTVLFVLPKSLASMKSVILMTYGRHWLFTVCVVECIKFTSQWLFGYKFKTNMEYLIRLVSYKYNYHWDLSVLNGTQHIVAFFLSGWD